MAAGLKNGKTTFFVPEENRFEAEALGKGRIFGVSSLKQAVGILTTKEPDQLLQSTSYQHHKKTTSLYDTEHYGDLSDVKRHWVLKRALEVATAGRYNLFLFGLPGSGKTMAAQRLPTILPPLSEQESLEVTQIHSLAGMLAKDSGLITYAPLWILHHSASIEGVIGGGRIPRPGEVSLAHHGILFLDEASQLRLSSDIRF